MTHMPHHLFCVAHFCELHGPLTLLCTQKQLHVSVWPGSLLALCAACALSLPNGATSVVSETRDCLWVSTKYPTSQQIYTSLMKLVMKCLSVESAADPLKPVFFGDTASGFCLAKVFSLRDVHARGGERKYALMLVSDSELAVVHGWGVAAQYVAEIITLVQRQVEKRRESSLLGGVDPERYLRRSKNVPKSLVELTGDLQIFVKLHRVAAELLADLR